MIILGYCNCCKFWYWACKVLLSTLKPFKVKSEYDRTAIIAGASSNNNENYVNQQIILTKNRTRLGPNQEVTFYLVYNVH